MLSPLYIPGSAEWSELLCTVALDDPREVEVRFPEDEDIQPLGDQIERLRIEAPGYGLVDVRPKTVVAVDPDTAQLVYSPGEKVVDDRDLLKAIAQRAWAWHWTPRYAVSLLSAIVTGQVAIGRRIVSLREHHGIYPINSVVTEITVQFPFAESGTPPLPKMTVATAYAELDPVTLF